MAELGTFEMFAKEVALQPVFVVVSGLPASGKTSLAKALAPLLGLPMVDKDDLLEALFDSHGVVDKATRRQLSLLADSQLQQQVKETTGALVCSWWRHPLSAIDSGTDTRWLAQLPGSLIELHCQCVPEVAVQRFVARRRHPSHLDHGRSSLELLESFRVQARLGPLGVGVLIQDDASQTRDLNALCAKIAAIVANASGNRMLPKQ